MYILQMVRFAQIFIASLAGILLATKFISYIGIYRGGSEGIPLPLKLLGWYSLAEIDASSSKTQKRFMRHGNFISKAFWILLLILAFVTFFPKLISLS